MKLFNTLVLLLGFVLSSVQADDRTLGNVIGDIYSKGELDGQSVFFVLGLDSAKEFAKNSASSMSTLEDLKEAGIQLGADLKGTSRLVFNDGQGDLVEAVEQGFELSKDSAKYVITGPKDTVKKIPRSFEISMHHAREGYYESENEIVGGFKYAGHATWFMVEGSYYLLVEAPAKAVLGVVGAALGVPAALAFQGVAIASNLILDVGGFTVKVAYGAIKNTLKAAMIASAYTYSVVSASTVAVSTVIVALPVLAYQGIKYLRPRVKLGGHKLVQKDTEENRKAAISIAVDTLNNFARSVNLNPADLVIKTRDKIRKYGPKRHLTKVVGSVVSLMNKGKDILRVDIHFNKNSTKLTGKLKYKTYKQLQKENYSKEKLRQFFDSSLAI